MGFGAGTGAGAGAVTAIGRRRRVLRAAHDRAAGPFVDGRQAEEPPGSGQPPLPHASSRPLAPGLLTLKKFLRVGRLPGDAGRAEGPVRLALHGDSQSLPRCPGSAKGSGDWKGTERRGPVPARWSLGRAGAAMRSLGGRAPVND